MSGTNSSGRWSSCAVADSYTMARGLQTLFWNMSTESRWTELFAGLVIVMLPLVIVFIFLQDRITEGLTVGALKG